MKKNEEKAIKTRRKRKRRHYVYYIEEGREHLGRCRFPGYCPLLTVVNESSSLGRALDSKAAKGDWKYTSVWSREKSLSVGAEFYNWKAVLLQKIDNFSRCAFRKKF